MCKLGIKLNYNIHNILQITHPLGTYLPQICPENFLCVEIMYLQVFPPFLIIISMNSIYRKRRIYSVVLKSARIFINRGQYEWFLSITKNERCGEEN